jgi:hypothetical protein
MSAVTPIADIAQCRWDVRFVPTAEVGDPDRPAANDEIIMELLRLLAPAADRGRRLRARVRMSPEERGVVMIWDFVWRTLMVLTVLTAGSLLGLILWEVLFGIGNWPRSLSGG